MEGKTKNGYNADEVISALQKDIRRCNIEQACYWAYELLVSAKKFRDKFWERMGVICAEDIGMENPQAIATIEALRKLYYRLDEQKGDSKIVGIFATMFLAYQRKNRYADHLYHKFKNMKDSDRPKIPDYALDKHTKRGREMGRGDEHFNKIGAVTHEPPKTIPRF